MSGRSDGGSHQVMGTRTRGADTQKETPAEDLTSRQVEGREACLARMVKSVLWNQDPGSNPDSDTHVALGT